MEEGIPHRFHYYGWIIGLFVAVMLISNTVSTKILNLGWFMFDGGTILFPLSYIFGDILTEVYGYSRARKVIWIGFFSVMLMSLVYFIVGALPAADGWQFQESYNNILGIVPRIAFASLIAFFAGEFSNSYILAKLKIKTKGKYLWLRTIGSTLVGELLDTLIFVLIAFAGVMPTSLLIPIIISNYVFKVGIEILMTPVTYKAVSFLKKREGIDYYDYKTDFNPFSVK